MTATIAPRLPQSARSGRPPLCLDRLYAGLRVAIGVSGGADSVALLRLLADEQSRLGLVLSVAHVHHGIRGADADADAAFVEALARALCLEFAQHTVNTPAAARAAGMGLEETARDLRYRWFGELLAGGRCDAVVTAHTLNDQAETVLHKLIRGAWTEGLSGIHPVVNAGSPGPGPTVASRGIILRPLLGATRAQVITWLQDIGQRWREDATNTDLSYTRNRIRNTLLPELATYNPRIATQLAHVATLAREDEAYWEAEVARILPGLLLPGRPVRGGGRASSTLPGERTLAIEVERLRSYPPSLIRRLLRGAARQLGVDLDFEQTGRLVALVNAGNAPNSAGRRQELTGELQAERTPRELRLVLTAGGTLAGSATSEPIEFPIPGEAAGYGWRLHCSMPDALPANEAAPTTAVLRAAHVTDRVQLRYSRGAPKRIKEVFERLGVPAADRAGWPVLEVAGEVVWMAGAVLEPGAILIDAKKLP